MFYHKKVGNNRPIQLLFIRTSVGILEEFSFHLKNSDRISLFISYYTGKYINDVLFFGVIFSRNLSDFRQKCSWLQLYFCAVQSVYHYIRPSGYMPYAHFSFFWCNSKLCIPSNIDTQMNLKSFLVLGRLGYQGNNENFCIFPEVSNFLGILFQIFISKTNTWLNFRCIFMSAPENKKPENENLNSRFTLKSL